EAGVDFLKGALEEARANEVGQAALAQALSATSKATGVTADMANELAGSLQLLTKFSDDEVLSATTILGRFEEIGKGVFPDATKSTLDLASALGIDTVSAAKLLGKALAEPGAGLARLKAAGVVFSDSQEKVIKKLFETGHAAEAQKLILEELSKTIGGTAEAAGKTFEGQAAIFSHMVDDIKQSLGDVLLPLLNDVMSTVIAIFRNPAVQAAIAKIAEGIRDVFTALATLARTVAAAVMPLLEKLGGWLNTTGIPALQDFAGLVGSALRGGFNFVGNLINNDILPTLQGFSGWVQTSFLPVVSDIGGKVGTALGGAFVAAQKAFDAFNRQDLSGFLEAFNIAPDISAKLEEAWQAMDQGFKLFLEKTGIQAAKETVTTLFDGLRKEIQDGAKGLWDAWNTFQTNGPRAFSWFEKLDKEGLGSFLKSLNVSPEIADTLEAVTTELDKQLQNATEAARTGLANLGRAFDAFKTDGLRGFLEAFNVDPGIVTFFVNAEKDVREGIAKIPAAIEGFKNDGFSGFLATFDIAPEIGKFLDDAVLTVTTKLEQVRLAVADKIGKLPAAFEGFKTEGIRGFLEAFDVSPEIVTHIDNAIKTVGTKFEELRIAVATGVAKIPAAFDELKKGNLDGFLAALDVSPDIRARIDTVIQTITSKFEEIKAAIGPKFEELKLTVEAGIARVQLAFEMIKTGNLDGFLASLGIAPEVRVKIEEIVTAVKEEVANIPKAFEAFKKGDLSDFLAVFDVSPEVATQMEKITTAVKKEIDKLPAKFAAFQKGDLSDFLETFDIAPDIALKFEEAATAVTDGLTALNLRWGTELQHPPPPVTFDNTALNTEFDKMGAILDERRPQIDEKIKKFREIFGTLSTIFGGLATGVTSFDTGITKLNITLPSLSEVFKTFVDGFLIQAAKLIEKWNLLVLGWKDLNVVADKFKVIWKDTVAAFDKSGGLIDTTKTALENMGNYVRDTLTGVLAPFLTQVEGIRNAFADLWDYIKKVIEALGNLGSHMPDLGGIASIPGNILGNLPKITLPNLFGPPPPSIPSGPGGPFGNSNIERNASRQVNIHGPITIVANNPQEFWRELESRTQDIVVMGD
nr:hypothetical protein [Blastocatellia bacterium]